MAKKIIKKTSSFLFHFVEAFFLFIFLYIILTFLISRIPINAEPQSSADVEIYILTNGVHTDIVVPAKNEIKDWTKKFSYENTLGKDTNNRLLALGWGDKGFYLETPQWSQLKASVAFNAATGLSSSAIHATYYYELKETETCIKLKISSNQYKRLVNFVLKTVKSNEDGSLQPIPTRAVSGKNDAFYEAHGKYSMFNTCNSWANNALKSCGQKCAVWTAFDGGILSKYN